MNKVTDHQLNEITEHIDNKKWEEAEKILIKLSKTGNSSEVLGPPYLIRVTE